MIRALSLTATALLAAMAAQPALAGSAMSAGEYISKLGIAPPATPARPVPRLPVARASRPP